MPSWSSNASILHIVQEGAEEKVIKLAENPLNEWPDGGTLVITYACQTGK